MSEITITAIEHFQVSGVQGFDGREWRSAILSYLHGIWKADVNVIVRPKISFGDIVTLRLDSVNRKYYVYGQGSDPNLHREIPHFSREQRLVTHGDQFEVEGCLIRFIENARIRVLELWIGHAIIGIWKGPKRSQLFVAAEGLPKEYQGPVW